MEVSLYLESSRSISSKAGPLYAPLHSRKSHMGLSVTGPSTSANSSHKSGLRTTHLCVWVCMHVCTGASCVHRHINSTPQFSQGAACTSQHKSNAILLLHTLFLYRPFFTDCAKLHCRICGRLSVLWIAMNVGTIYKSPRSNKLQRWHTSEVTVINPLPSECTAHYYSAERN